MRQLPRLVCVIGLAFCAAATAAAPEPEPVRASVLYSQYDVRSASFTADERTVYFVVKIAEYRQVLYVAHRVGERWSDPELLPFSGNASQIDPFITPDGSRLFFAGRQPGHSDLDIWESDKTAIGWSEPRVLGGDVNSPADEAGPWLAPSGRLYFSSSRAGGEDLYTAEPAANGFGDVRALAAVNTDAYEYEPSVSPDENTLVFTALARPEELHEPGALYQRSDLYISRKVGGVWQGPQHLPEPINTGATEQAPAFSADGRWLTFMSERHFAMNQQPLEYDALQRALAQPGNGGGDIYRVPVSALGATP
jgi:Tol biopolymer transport system component